MTQLKQLLEQTVQEHPACELTDLFKLAYQSEFGGGHLLRDESAARDMLHAEWEATPACAQAAIFTPLSGGWCRFHIAGAKAAGVSEELFWRIFKESARRVTGTAAGFAAKAALIETLCKNQALPFSAESAADFYARWQQNGSRPFSHSQDYRAAYAPAYRVVSVQYESLLPLLCRLWQLGLGANAVVGIDGRCGSGKTTLAALLEQLFGAPVIHMDDFFLPLELRSEERLAQPGGNVHYERFAEEVAAKLHTGRELTYRVFSCAIKDYDGTVTVPVAPLVVVEGSYALHPRFGALYDCRIFCDVAPAEQQRRILARNGEKMYEMFRTRWIPMEEAYFDASNLRASCDFVLYPGQENESKI